MSIAEWATRRFLMKRIRTFFGGLATPTTSEFWLTWGGLAAKLVCLWPAACGILEAVARGVGFPSADVMLATLLAIGFARMTSKAAHATA